MFKLKFNQKIIYFLLLTFTTILLIIDFSAGAQASQARYYDELKFSTLPDIQIPKYTRFQMDNGMIVYLMEDHELPLINGNALFRTGDRFDPANQVGLAGMVGQVMRTGGTKKHSPDQINEILEQRAASVETSIGTTAAGASFNTLTEDTETVFSLFAQIIREPVFAAEKLDLAKNQERGAIARRNDNPNSIASREFQKLIYGKDHPYARIAEYNTLEEISRQDLLEFHQKYFYPNNMILGIVGDFDSQKMRSLVEKYFADWQSNPQLKLPQLPQVSQSQDSGIFLVNQPQLTQSNILLGHLGGKLDNPDYPALSVLNGVMNGFGGRLFNQVRSREGLSYSVYGYWDAEYDYPGVFIAGGQTRSEATVPFIKAIFSELERIRNQPISEAELNYAKESVLNSFVFNFQDPSQTLSRLMRYEYYGYPSDFIFTYRQGVEATTIADVQRVAKKYLNPNKLVTLVVGNANAIQPPLTSITSKVTAVDISIPSPKSTRES